MTKKKKNKNERIRCDGCGWKGFLDELEEDEDKDALVCPRCGTIGWRFA